MRNNQFQTTLWSTENYWVLQHELFDSWALCYTANANLEYCRICCCCCCGIEAENNNKNSTTQLFQDVQRKGCEMCMWRYPACSPDRPWTFRRRADCWSERCREASNSLLDAHISGAESSLLCSSRCRYRCHHLHSLHHSRLQSLLDSGKGL